MTKPEAIRWRPVALADLPALTDMARDFYEHERLAFSVRRFRTAMRRLVEQPEHGVAWMIARSGQNIGYVVVCHGYSIEYGGVTGFLDELYVAPEFRGHGVGTATLAFLRREAKRRRWVKLLLEVVRGNREAARLYLRQGFEDHGRTLMTADPTV